MSDIQPPPSAYLDEARSASTTEWDTVSGSATPRQIVKDPWFHLAEKGDIFAGAAYIEERQNDINKVSPHRVGTVDVLFM